MQFMSYSVYILKGVDQSLYVGCTNALEKRLKQHNNQEIMNSDLTPVPLEAASPVRSSASNGTRAHSVLTLMGFIIQIQSAFGVTTGQANENSIRHPCDVLSKNRVYPACL